MEASFPDWGKFTPEFAAAELPRLMEAAERDVSALEGDGADTFEGLVWRLDDATRELWRCWGDVSHMLSVMNSQEWRRVEEEFQPRIVAFALRVSQSRRIYALAKALLSKEVADPVRKRILQKMVESAELSGVGLEGDSLARFNEIQARLAKLSMDFANSVIDATKAFSLEKDGKTYTIDDANYPETMKHCADRDVRERLCRARSTRATENETRIAEILGLRREEARLLGFEDFASKSLASKCAPSVAAVMEMIDGLDAATAEVAEREKGELADFAARRLGIATVEPWDVAFCAERLREEKYAYSEEALKRHFGLEAVLGGLFRIAKFLFGVDVEELRGADRPPVWHDDVRFFAVREGGQTIAHFYFDPFVRNGLKQGGAWMNEFRNRRRGVLPLALVCANFPVPDAEGRCLLPLREVETLFHEFGHALQQMLTRVEEEDAAGINLVEWDAVEVASQFMENWCLDDRTGITVPADLKGKVRAAKNFRAASACRRQLAFAKTDMLLHGADGADASPDGVKRATFRHFGLPQVEGDRFLCAFTHIFAGGYAAGYYGYKWAEVMSADCFGAFEEAGLSDDAAMRALGAKYRETVLALGGSKSALEVFREFRGRDPEITALLRQQDLICS